MHFICIKIKILKRNEQKFSLKSLIYLLFKQFLHKMMFCEKIYKNTLALIKIACYY